MNATNTYYSIDDGNGDAITTGISSEVEAQRVALRQATERGQSVYLWAPGATEAVEIEPYVASLTAALAWARTAEAGDYLVTYRDAGSTPRTDPGNRCGYSDMGIDEINRVLGNRDLRLATDDRGLVAQAVRS